MAGSDPSLATVALQRRSHALQGLALGLKITEPSVAEPAIPSSVQQTDSEDQQGRLLSNCIISYLAETGEHKAERTFRAYRETLALFTAAVKREHIEDITREDMLAFAAFLKKRGNAPRTVRNRVDYFQIFLHHFGLPSLLKGKDLPKFTEKQVRAYRPTELARMFGQVTQDESDLLHFLLCTGAREQEARFACWADVDLESRTYTFTEHLDLGYRPKDKEEGTIPIPDLLVKVLRNRREKYPRTRLIFSGTHGKSNGHALHIIKRLALGRV
jgi:integrase